MPSKTAFSAGIRVVGGRSAKDYTIIVAYDGELTEDDYFRGWKLIIPPSRLSLEGLYVKSGGNVLKAVEAAARRKKKLKNYAEFWCVCDVDDTNGEDLAKAYSLADQNDIRLCLSSRCFEVWILLHFEFSEASIATEDEAVGRVGQYYADYGKPYKLVPFHELYSETDTALKNASKLHNSGLANPMTQVHNLVRKLKQNC